LAGHIPGLFDKVGKFAITVSPVSHKLKYMEV
jgi:hypothetical protein